LFHIRNPQKWKYNNIFQYLRFWLCSYITNVCIWARTHVSYLRSEFRSQPHVPSPLRLFVFIRRSCPITQNPGFSTLCFLLVVRIIWPIFINLREKFVHTKEGVIRRKDVAMTKIKRIKEQWSTKHPTEN
jgi:hypothetical protein